jgi:hypothetical protein
MFRIFAGVLALLFLVVSCRAKVPESPLLPPETPLFVYGGVGYGVVNVSFALVLGELPPAPSESSGIIRKGGVVRVIERRSVPAAEETAPAVRIWALVEARGSGTMPGGAPRGGLVRGWLPDESIDFYENLPKAETASLLMLR